TEARALLLGLVPWFGPWVGPVIGRRDFARVRGKLVHWEEMRSAHAVSLIALASAVACGTSSDREPAGPSAPAPAAAHSGGAGAGASSREEMLDRRVAQLPPSAFAWDDQGAASAARSPRLGVDAHLDAQGLDLAWHGERHGVPWSTLVKVRPRALGRGQAMH